MNTFGIIYTAVLGLIFVVGIFLTIKNKSYKYFLSLVLLAGAILLLLLTLKEDEPGSFQDLIYVLFSVVATILSFVSASVVFILQSLKRNK